MAEQDQTPGASGQRRCRVCGSQLGADQDWCLNCGTGTAGSHSPGRPGWRAAAAAGGSAVVLLAGTAVAAVAALNHHSSPPPATVAQAQATTAPAAPAPTATTPAPTTSTPAETTTPAEVGTLATPTIKLPKAPASKTPPPKIPLESPTPPPAPPQASEVPAGEEEAAEAPAGEGEAESGEGGQSGGGSGTGNGGAGNGGGKAKTHSGEGKSETEVENTSGKQGAEPLEPLLLDTDAAARFNPYRYPASSLGDPQLAIDGAHTTAWTAVIEPGAIPAGEEVPVEEEGTSTTEAQSPGGAQTTPEGPVQGSTTPTATTPTEEPGRVPTGPVGVGLTLNLEQPQSVGRLLLSSSTSGMTFAVYAANGRRAPASAPDAPAESGAGGRWTGLAGPRVLNGRHASVTLKTAGRSYRWILLWIVKAPETPPAGRPAGQVAVNEVELLPPASR